MIKTSEADAFDLCRNKNHVLKLGGSRVVGFIDLVVDVWHNANVICSFVFRSRMRTTLTGLDDLLGRFLYFVLTTNLADYKTTLTTDFHAEHGQIFFSLYRKHLSFIVMVNTLSSRNQELEPKEKTRNVLQILEPGPNRNLQLNILKTVDRIRTRYFHEKFFSVILEPKSNTQWYLISIMFCFAQITDNKI